MEACEAVLGRAEGTAEPVVTWRGAARGRVAPLSRGIGSTRAEIGIHILRFHLVPAASDCSAFTAARFRACRRRGRSKWKIEMGPLQSRT